MWKFVVSWYLVKMIVLPCPDYKVDEFGRSPSFDCDILHTKEIKVAVHKDFFDRDSAVVFYGRAIKQVQSYSGSLADRIDSVRIDSVFVKIKGGTSEVP